VTIVDVATKAGVSLGTASRVLNNRRDVDQELRRRVMDAVRVLGYVRSGHGRRAARESRPIITFVLGNREFLHPMHARMLQGAEQHCEEMGYYLVFKRLGYTAATPVTELGLPSLLLIIAENQRRIAESLGHFAHVLGSLVAVAFVALLPFRIPASVRGILRILRDGEFARFPFRGAPLIRAEEDAEERHDQSLRMRMRTLRRLSPWSLRSARNSESVVRISATSTGPV